MLPVSIPEKLGTVCRRGKSMYYARLSIRIQDDKLEKLEDLLQRWHAEEIVFRQLSLPTYYRVECVLDSPRKVFRFKEMVERYGGRVLFFSWSKTCRNADPTKHSLERHNTSLNLEELKNTTGGGSQKKEPGLRALGAA